MQAGAPAQELRGARGGERARRQAAEQLAQQVALRPRARRAPPRHAQRRVEEKGRLRAQAARERERTAHDALGRARVARRAAQQQAAARVLQPRHDDVADAEGGRRRASLRRALPRASLLRALPRAPLLRRQQQLHHLEPPRGGAQQLPRGQLVQVVDARHAARARGAAQALHAARAHVRHHRHAARAQEL